MKKITLLILFLIAIIFNTNSYGQQFIDDLYFNDSEVDYSWLYHTPIIEEVIEDIEETNYNNYDTLEDSELNYESRIRRFNHNYHTDSYWDYHWNHNYWGNNMYYGTNWGYGWNQPYWGNNMYYGVNLGYGWNQPYYNNYHHNQHAYYSLNNNQPSSYGHRKQHNTNVREGNNINQGNSRQIKVNSRPIRGNEININNTVTKPKNKRGTKLNQFIETIYKANNNNRTDKKSNSRSNNYGNNNRSSKSNNRSSQNRSRRQ